MPSAPLRDDFVIGVDIGGTKVAAGLVGPSGEILSHTRNPMACSDGPASARYGEDAGIAGGAALCFAAAGGNNETDNSVSLPNRK